MAQHFNDGVQAFVCFDQQRGTGLAQVVEPDRWVSSSYAGTSKDELDCIDTDR